MSAPGRARDAPGTEEPAPIPVTGTLVVRGDRIVYASEGCALLAGRPAAELVGCSPLEFLDAGEVARILDLLERSRRGEPVPRTLELTLALAGGERRQVECHVEPDGADVSIHVRDLRGEEAHLVLLDALAAAGVAVRGERDEAAVHARVRQELQRLGVTCAMVRSDGVVARVEWICLPSSVEGALLSVTGRGPEGLRAPHTEFARQILGAGAAFTDDWTGAAATFLPPELRSRARTLLHEAGLVRAAGARIEATPGGGGLYLVLVGPWRGQDVPAVRLFGAQVAAALDAARTIADLSRRNADLAVLARVAALACEATDLRAFFAEAGRALLPVAGCDGLAVFVADEGGALARVHEEGARCSLAQGGGGDERPLATVLRDRNARVVPAPGGRDDASGTEGGAVALIPLVARSRAVGVLAAEFRAGAGAAGRALELLASAGAHFASTMESHRLVADLRHRVDELTLLVDIARAAAQLDPVLLLGVALRRICDTVGADAALAYLRDGERLILLSSTGVDAATCRAFAELPADAGPPGRAMSRRAPVQGRAEQCGTLHPRGAGGRPLGPCVAVPLLAKAEPVGTMVLMRAGEALFTAGEEELLSSLGVQLGLAVDAARLFSDVRRRLADLEAVHALAVRMFANAPGDAPALLQDGCREILQALSAKAVAVFLTRGDGALRLAASLGVPPELGPALGGEDPLAAEVLRTRTPLVTEDVTRDPRSSLCGRSDVPFLSVLLVPLGSRDEVRGVVYVADSPARRFSAADVALANALAGALGLGVENAGLHAEARRRVEELSLMNEAGRTIARSLDLDEVLREAVQATRRLVGAGRAWVLVHDGARGEVRLGASTAPVAGFEAPVSAAGHSLVGTVLEGRRPLRVDDLCGSPEGEAHRGVHGGRSLLAVPVVLRGEPLGVLCADEEGPRRFSDSDVQRITAVADRLAVAMQNAALYLETRQRAEQVALMNEVTRSLLQTLDIEQVLVNGVRNLARIVDAPAAYLAFVTDDGGALELRAAVGGDGRRVGERVPLREPSEDVATRVFVQRLPIMVADARTDPRVTPEMRARSGGTAYLGLPLVTRDQVIGAAVIAELRGPRWFTPAEMERAAAVANQLAVAADNARLYERLRSSYAELERAQQKLLRGERLAALGELSAIVAHEVRNPLAVIFNSLGPLRRLLKPGGDARVLFDIVEEEADRLNRIVGDLLDFARPSAPQLRPEDLGQLVADAAAAAGQPDGAQVELVSEVDPDLPPVAVDARQVRQAVLNVAVNAVQAMPRGGRITLRTRRDGGAALVEIEDTGGGIPEEVRERIFEPFFTTKAAGTGLGLAVVKRIVEGHGGTVSVRASPEAGTVFSLRFPLEASEPAGGR